MNSFMIEDKINSIIRSEILSDLFKNGGQDTRKSIEKYATRHNVPKQKIAGNLSFMKKNEDITIFSNFPNSIMFYRKK